MGGFFGFPAWFGVVLGELGNLGELQVLGQEDAGGVVVVVADEAREPEEIEEPPDAETAQGDPEKELGAGTSEIEVMEAEKEPEDKSKHQRFLATAEFPAIGFYCLRIEGAEGCFD